jgi:hypothetical protein
MIQKGDYHSDELLHEVRHLVLLQRSRQQAPDPARLDHAGE